MKRWATRFFVGVLLLSAVPTGAKAQSLLFDYLGFDYESPNPNVATFGELGSGYVGLGTVPNLFAPLVFNTATYEYTVVFNGLTSVNVTSIPPFLIIDYTPGTYSLYEDLISGGTAADYGTNPPSAVAPPTFVDGTLYLQGGLSNFQFVWNTATLTGGFNAVMSMTGGSQLPNIPPSQQNGWTFSGATGNALNIPEGYEHQIDGQAFLNKPVSAQHVTWGRLKTLFR